MQLLIGTHNPSKLSHIMKICAPLKIELLTPDDVGLGEFSPSEEGGVSAQEIARIKAEAWFNEANIPVLCEDSGLVYLDFPLDDVRQPGARVRRINNHEMTDEEFLSHYVQVAKSAGGKLRAAWQDSYCIALSGDEYHVFSQPYDELLPLSFIITDTPADIKIPGWPLDSISFHPEIGKYKSEMTEEERKMLFFDKSGSEESPVLYWLKQCLNPDIQLKS